MGLTQGSYEAFCLDQAVWYLGTVITQELDQVGVKKTSKDATNENTRKSILQKFLGENAATPEYADPAAAYAMMYPQKE